MEYSIPEVVNTEFNFIDKNLILEYVTEIDIFKLVFKDEIVEYEYVTSPLRLDTSPGCWFETDTNGKLYFRDFAYGTKPLDCFDVVQDHFKLPNFYQTLLFIKNTLILKQNLPKLEQKPLEFKQKRKAKTHEKFKLLASTRPFNHFDQRYWSQFGIQKQQLIHDRVFPIQSCKLLNTKKGHITISDLGLAYIYTKFESKHKKVYRPYQTKRKFITDCDNNDVGGIGDLPAKGKKLVITKSYKDYRILKNAGCTTIWFQNEGMIPKDEILLNLLSAFEAIVIFFDNDKAGLGAADKVVTHFNTLTRKKKVWKVHFSKEEAARGVKDPGEFYKKYGRQHLLIFLKQRNLFT